MTTPIPIEEARQRRAGIRPGETGPYDAILIAHAAIEHERAIMRRCIRELVLRVGVRCATKIAVEELAPFQDEATS